MNRGEERNQIAHQIAWEYTKHYDPLLSKECWCEIAVRDAIDLVDKYPRKGLVDIEKVCKVIKDLYAESGIEYAEMLIQIIRQKLEE